VRVGVPPDQVAIRLIGTVAIVKPSGTEEVGRPRQRAVLAALALQAGRTVSRTDLLNAVWGADPPPSSSGNLHTYMSGLRQLLGGAAHEQGLLRTESNGYRLAVPPRSVDVLEFDRLNRKAGKEWSAGDIEACLTAADSAAGMWRGTPLPGVGGPLAELERTRLEGQWLAVRQLRAQALLAADRSTEAVVECIALVRDHPLNEQVAMLLGRSLYRSGRVAEALGELNSLGKRLRDELGVRPNPEVTELYEQMLAGDLDIASAPGTHDQEIVRASGGRVSGPPTSADRAVPAQLPHRPWGFTGRVAELAELGRLRRRSVLISGYAGIGKTALAVTFAHLATAEFPDGQLYLDLRGSSLGPLTPTDALSQLLGALGVKGDDLQATEDGLAGQLRTVLGVRRFLIVLDDAADAEQVTLLLEVCENAVVVVTSRYRMPRLRIGHRMTLRGLVSEAATNLLMSGCGTPLLVGADDPAVDRLVEASDGVPLALRVAAVRVGADAPNSAKRLAELVTTLKDQTSRLSVFSLDDDQRASLRAGLERTFHRLPADAAELLAHLGRNAGNGTGIDALNWPATRSSRALHALTDACFLDENDHGEFIMPSLIRAYSTNLQQPSSLVTRQP
jgi:DNA-binding SARP family transcriptional activator